MQCSSSLTLFSPLKLPSLSSINSSSRNVRRLMEVSTFSYRKFIHFALDETESRTHLVPSPLRENFSSLMAVDGKTELQMISFQAPKIRLLRSLSIEGSNGMQLEIYSRCYNEQPMVLQGAGAGNDTTAAGVLADILDIQDLFS